MSRILTGGNYFRLEQKVQQYVSFVLAEQYRLCGNKCYQEQHGSNQDIIRPGQVILRPSGYLFDNIVYYYVG